MKIIDLFSGIGGFSLAGHWLGWETELFCERDIYCQRVLRHHFPSIPIYDDVTTLTEQIKGVHNFESDNFILTGGFPCQPFSQAGKRKGRDDERALFPAMLDVIRETQPRWVLGENVGGILSIESGDYFEQEVCTPLESLGYEIQTIYISASSVGAPHRRDRVWIIGRRTAADSDRFRFKRDEHQAGNREGNKNRRQHLDIYPGQRRNEIWGFNPGSRESINWNKFPSQSPVHLRDDGIPGKLVDITFPRWRKESIKMMGNSIVPQVAFEIFKAIQHCDPNHTDGKT